MRLIHYSCLELRWGAGMIELLCKEFLRHAVYCLRNQWLRTVSFIIDFIDIDVSWQKIVLALEFDWRRVYVYVCVTYIYWSSLLLRLDHITLRFEWNLWLVTCNILLMRLVLFPPSSWVGFAWLSDCLACLCAVHLQLRCKRREAIIIWLIRILLSFVHFSIFLIFIIDACTSHLLAAWEDGRRACHIIVAEGSLCLRSEKWLAKLLVFVPLTHLRILCR